jgi:M3 family oligoendopeptidase
MTQARPLTFDQFVYKRPDLEAMRHEFEKNLREFSQAATPAVQSRRFARLNALRRDFVTMYNICLIRYTCNTADGFYVKENDYFDAELPGYEELSNQFSKALLNAPFRDVIEKKFGPQLFTLAEMSLKTFKPDILEDLQQENALITEHTKLKSQAQIAFDGKNYTIAGIQPFEQSQDRDTRRRAAEAKWQFFADNAPAFERIFDDMVKTRHRIAQKLGYRNFVEVGYARMKRSDYTPEMVANFRKQVQEIIVPISQSLYERQRQRLGLEKLKYYDEEFKYPSGNPKPIGTPEEIVQNAARMYRELSAETDSFFRHMQDARLMDLVDRSNKAPGGYCTYIPNNKAPFIFSNFNGTSGDIDVLTHEVGHAFQVWSSSGFPFDEYNWPTYDAAEIHSMSMEFFTWPWMHLFFGEQTDKYHFSHLSSALHFLPYGVAVDEFQHIVYENPEMTPAERNAAWSALERKYLPQRDYEDNAHLSAGRLWQKQNHIFNSPFYYIDYTLAQICALQFWSRDRRNHKAAWNDYVRLCKAGGSRSFLGLVALAKLRSPFEDGCVESVSGEINRFLESVDDSGF